MSYIDTLDQAIDRKMMESQAQKIKLSMNQNTDYSVIEVQVNGFLQYVEAKSIVRELRQEEQQGQTVSIDTRPAKKGLDDLMKLIDGLGK